MRSTSFAFRAGLLFLLLCCHHSFTLNKKQDENIPYRHDFGKEGEREDRIKHSGMSIFSNWIQLDAFFFNYLYRSVYYIYIYNCEKTVNNRCFIQL